MIHKATPYDLYGPVDGKHAIIVDDMISSGSTIIPAAKLCLERGAKSVSAAVVHPDFSINTPEKLNASEFQKVYVTNTIAITEKMKFDKMEVLSVAPIIAQELQNITH